jgi:ribosomal subunit interface protein
VDVIFKGRHTDVLERFRKHATAKLSKIERLNAKAIRVDVEVSAERNPRQSGRKERVELTITSSGPAIRAEAAAEDRFAALDMALAKLESRLRRANDRRKGRHGAHAAVRVTDLPPTDDESLSGPVAPPLAGQDAGTAAPGAGSAPGAAGRAAAGAAGSARGAAETAPASGTGAPSEDVVSIDRDGDEPLVVREKFHHAHPMAIDQALLEMELVGHDFFVFRDVHGGLPSVVYRRRGYQYGVIRLVEERPDVTSGEPPRSAAQAAPNGLANGQPKTADRLSAG